VGACSARHRPSRSLCPHPQCTACGLVLVGVDVPLEGRQPRVQLLAQCRVANAQVLDLGLGAEGLKAGGVRRGGGKERHTGGQEMER